MGVEIDRHGVELSALVAVVDFRGACVLEVGCGDGRLARRYAHMSRLVVGVDLDIERLNAAVFNSAAVTSLSFVGGCSAPLPFRDDAFDVALFGWSL